MRRVCVSVESIAQRVYITLVTILEESLYLGKDEDKVFIDYMDAQALRTLLETEYAEAPAGIKEQSRLCYDMVMTSLLNDFYHGANGEVYFSRYELQEILRVLDMYYLLKNKTPLELQFRTGIFIEYFVRANEEWVRVTTIDGKSEEFRYDYAPHTIWWLVVFQDIKDHELLPEYAQIRKHKSMKEWFRDIIREHYYLDDSIPDSAIFGKNHIHHKEA